MFLATFYLWCVVEVATKASNVSCFCETKQKKSVGPALISLALQSDSAGSVLTNDGTLGAGIRELKLGVAAPLTNDAISLPISDRVISFQVL